MIQFHTLKIGGNRMNKIRGKVFCEKKGKYRSAFRTREKADFFIKNFDLYMEGMDTEFKPVRSFYCVSCGTWHITHIPLTPESEWTEDRDRKIQQLEVLSQRLRAEFRKNDWQAWKPIVEEGMELLAFFRAKPEFEKLVESTEKQLEHCSAIIRTAEAKETGSANDDFKCMRKSIEQKAKALDYDGFESEACQMVRHFRDMSLRKALMPVSLEFLTAITICVEDDDTMGIISEVMEQAAKSVPDSREVEAEELYSQVLGMTLGMDKLFVLGLPRQVWDVLQSKVNKIASVLECCFGGHCSPDGFPLMEKVRIVANERMLDEAAGCINEGDKELVMEFLQHADVRMSKLPFSKKKVELMQKFCELGKTLYD